VQFVNEQDDLAFLLGEIIENGFQALLEFTAELRARNQGTHVQRQDALAAQSLGHFVVDDALREAFDDCGLADARLTDQHRIILGTALQNLDRASDLLVATDDRIELALLGALRQVDRVAFQCLAGVLRVRVVNLLPATEVVDRFLDGTAYSTRLLEQALQRRAVVEGREYEQFARDVLIVALLSELVGDIEEFAEVIAEMYVTAGAFYLGQPVDRVPELGAQQVHVCTRLGQQAAYATPLLVQQRDHQVRGLYKLVVLPDRQRLRIRQRHLKFACQFVQTHVTSLEMNLPGNDVGITDFKLR
jgi:hypothetical protein